MKIANQLIELIKHNESSTGLVANQLGQSHSNLLNKLSRDNLRISELEDIAHAIGYTDMEIVLRGTKEDAVILEDSVEYKKHSVYMMFDNDVSLEDDIKQNGFRDTTFRMMLLEVLSELFEPELQKIFGDTLDAYLPHAFKEEYKTATKESLRKLGIGSPLNKPPSKIKRIKED